MYRIEANLVWEILDQDVKDEKKEITEIFPGGYHIKLSNGVDMPIDWEQHTTDRYKNTLETNHYQLEEDLITDNIHDDDTLSDYKYLITDNEDPRNSLDVKKYFNILRDFKSVDEFATVDIDENELLDFRSALKLVEFEIYLLEEGETEPKEGNTIKFL